MKNSFGVWLVDRLTYGIYRNVNNGNRERPIDNYAVREEVEGKINALTNFELIDYMDQWHECNGELT